MKTFIIACALLGLGPEGEMIPAWFLEICPEEPPVYTSLAACKRQAKRVARAVNSRRFTATCEQRVWYLFTPTGVGSNSYVADSVLHIGQKGPRPSSLPSRRCKSTDLPVKLLQHLT
jgi:hypothetical protein